VDVVMLVEGLAAVRVVRFEVNLLKLHHGEGE